MISLIVAVANGYVPKQLIQIATQSPFQFKFPLAPASFLCLDFLANAYPIANNHLKYFNHQQTDYLQPNLMSKLEISTLKIKIFYHIFYSYIIHKVYKMN